MASPNINLLGDVYPSVAGVTLPKQGGGTATFPWVEGSQTITQNGTYDVSSLSEAVVNVSGGGGADVPTFTLTYDSEWLVVSVTCDKTYSECIDIALASVDCYAVVINQPAPGEGDAYNTTAVFGLDDWDNPTMIIFRTVDSGGFPVDEFHYLADGTITLPTPVDWADCPTIRTNGQHYPDPGRYFWGVIVDVPGASDRLVLLQTTSLGSLTTTSTQAASTGKTVTLAPETGWQNYDLFVIDISVDTKINGRHTSSVSFGLAVGQTNVSTKDAYALYSNVWNSKLSSNGVQSTRQSTSKYGVYVNNFNTVSGSTGVTASLPIYYRYNSNSTGTLNGTYTARVYGVKLIDLIGG